MEKLGHFEQSKPKEPFFDNSFISDHSFVFSRLSLREQSVGVEYSELEPYFEWIRGQAENYDPITVLSKAAKMSMNNLKPDDAAWEDIVANNKDQEYTLGRTISEGVNSCFHRAVFLNLLLQEAKISSAVIEGILVEDAREDIQKPTDDVAMIKPGGFYITREDKPESHVWNLARIDSKVYLVDSADLVEVDGKQTPLIREVTDEMDGKIYCKVRLSNDLIRHYIGDAVVNPAQNS